MAKAIQDMPILRMECLVGIAAPKLALVLSYLYPILANQLCDLYGVGRICGIKKEKMQMKAGFVALLQFPNVIADAT